MSDRVFTQEEYRQAVRQLFTRDHGKAQNDDTATIGHNPYTTPYSKLTRRKTASKASPASTKGTPVRLR